MSVSAAAASYLETKGVHWSGSLWRDQIEAIERSYNNRRGVSMETGCGTSTILLSNLSLRHLVFCHDDRDKDNSSVDFVLSAPIFDRSRTEFVFGPTQCTLPNFRFNDQLDLALIDGPHAFPFPELEYYFIYPHLREDAILIIDDIHIPTIYNLYSFLKEDPMFSLVERVATTAIFRRTQMPTFNPYGDGWQDQEYNKRRFPIYPLAERLTRLVPKRVTHLVPRRIRRAIKAHLEN